MDKNFLTSKTIQGLLAALLGVIISNPHVHAVVAPFLGDVDTQMLAGNILSAVGLAWAAYGRCSIPQAALRLGLAAIQGIAADASAGANKPTTPPQGGFVRAGALGLIVVLGLGVLAASGCAVNSAATNPSVAYTPPAACVQDNATGKYDSEILAVLPNPTATGVVLQLADYGAISKGLYKAEDALKVIADIRSAVASSTSYGALAAYVATKLHSADAAAGVVIFTNTGFLAQFTSTQPLTDCDRAIIARHLDNQETLVRALAAAGK